jgi:hypothetical protein
MEWARIYQAKILPIFFRGKNLFLLNKTQGTQNPLGRKTKVFRKTHKASNLLKNQHFSENWGV